MPGQRKVVSTLTSKPIFDNIIELFIYYRVGEAFYESQDEVVTFCNDVRDLLLQNSEPSFRPRLMACSLDSLLSIHKIPDFICDLFEFCRESEIGKNIFFQFMLPSFSLHHYGAGLELWYSEYGTAYFTQESSYIRSCTERMIALSRPFNSDVYKRSISINPSHTTQTTDLIITTLKNICEKVPGKTTPRILNVGCGMGSEMAPTSYVNFGRFIPIFFNIDINKQAISFCNRLINRYHIPGLSLLMGAEKYSNTEGLTAALMPDPDIVLVRHFHITDNPRYPYAALRSLSNTNGTGIVTFYMEGELNEFIEHLNTCFIPSSIPKYSTLEAIHLRDFHEYIVVFTEFPEKSFVYKHKPFAS